MIMDETKVKKGAERNTTVSGLPTQGPEVLPNGAEVTAVQPGHVLKMKTGQATRAGQQRHLQPALFKQTRDKCTL